MAQQLRTGNLEKKGTLGMWSKKWVSFNGETLELVVADKETSRDTIFTSTLRTIMVHQEDNAVLNFVGTKAGDQISLRGSSLATAGNWYDYIYSALEQAKVVRPRHGFLPRKDPRFGISFLRALPEEYITRFTKLEHSVMYWFAEVKKYEKGGFGSSKPVLEDRIAFLSDKCLYVTQRDGTVTHCVKVAEAEMCYTNLTLLAAKGTGNSATDPPGFVVFKYKNFDLHLQAGHLKSLLQAVAAIYNHHHSYKTLDIKESESPMDGAVRLNLNPDAKMAMVVPTSKTQLKKALDQFAAKHGIEFEADTSSASNAPPSGTSGDGTGMKTAPKKAEPVQSKAAPTNDTKELPMTDPLACFLANCDLGKLYFPLADQAVDLDCLEVMDADDIANFGVKDPAVVNLLKYKLGKDELLQEARDQAESVQRGSKWAKSTVVDAHSPTLPQNQELSSPQAAPPQARPTNALLDSDSDDDLGLVAKSSPTTAKKPISFDSSDSDDLDLGALMKPKPKTGIKISFDSSDDDDFLPASPKPAVAKKPVDLDDDDI